MVERITSASDVPRYASVSVRCFGRGWKRGDALPKTHKTISPAQTRGVSESERTRAPSVQTWCWVSMQHHDARELPQAEPQGAHPCVPVPHALRLLRGTWLSWPQVHTRQLGDLPKILESIHVSDSLRYGTVQQAP